MKSERDRLVECRDSSQALSLNEVLRYHHDIIQEPEQSRKPFSILEILLRGQRDSDQVGIFILTLIKIVFMIVICAYHHGNGICHNNMQLLTFVLIPTIGTYLGLKISQRLMVKTLRRDLLPETKYWCWISVDVLVNGLIPLISTTIVIQDQKTLLDVAINFAIFIMLIDVDGIILSATRRTFMLYSEAERIEYERVLIEGSEAEKRSNAVVELFPVNHLAEGYTITTCCIGSVLFITLYTTLHCKLIQ